MAAFYWLRDMAAIAGIMWFVGKIFINPKGLEDDLKKIGSTYTDAVRTLAGVESTTISEISRMEDKND